MKQENSPTSEVQTMSDESDYHSEVDSVKSSDMSNNEEEGENELPTKMTKKEEVNAKEGKEAQPFTWKSAAEGESTLKMMYETKEEKDDEDGSSDDGLATNDEDETLSENRRPLLDCLLAMLQHMRPAETVKQCIGRLSRSEKDDAIFNVVSEACSSAMLQFSRDVQENTREKMVRECYRLKKSQLPEAFMLKWDHAPAVVHGPFTKEQIDAWKAKGVFQQKKATVCNINNPDVKSQQYVSP